MNCKFCEHKDMPVLKVTYGHRWNATQPTYTLSYTCPKCGRLWLKDIKQYEVEALLTGISQIEAEGGK